MPKCKLCTNPQREDIERRLAARELTQVQAAAIIKSTPSAISRHMRNCFPKKVAEWVKPEATKEETLNVVNELTRSHKNLLELYEAARDQGNIDTAIRALESQRRHLELVAKLTGQLNQNEAQEFNFLMSQEYWQVVGIINTTLAPYPDLREKLSDALSKAGNEQ